MRISLRIFYLDNLHIVECGMLRSLPLLYCQFLSSYLLALLNKFRCSHFGNRNIYTCYILISWLFLRLLLQLWLKLYATFNTWKLALSFSGFQFHGISFSVPSHEPVRVLKAKVSLVGIILFVWFPLPFVYCGVLPTNVTWSILEVWHSL